MGGHEARKARAQAAVDSAGPDLADLADRIHAHPELAYDERQAAGWLADFLMARGFGVERGVGGVATAFLASAGPSAGGRPTIAFLAEYDALPGIGHGCGHNLIAAMSVGAGLACRAALPPDQARIVVLGTPAEEGGGGKAALLEAGVFEGIDAALMVHPWDRTRAWAPALGLLSFRATFHGKAAHAAASPHLGVNALDAMILLFNGIALLRQQVTDDARLHGIITRGGDRPNIIPVLTEAEFYVRAREPASVRDLFDRVKAVAEGAARATGCRVAVERTGYVLDPVRQNRTLADLFRRNAERLGYREEPAPGPEMAGSTDFGNVSQRIAGLHAYLPIADAGTPLHSSAFAQAAGSERGKAAMRAGAAALAQTALDLLCEPGAMERAKGEMGR